MKKRTLILIATIVALLALAVPTLVMAHSLDVSATTFYACEAPNTIGSITVGSVDVNSITQDNSLDCSGDTNFTARVQWSVTGPQGDPGLKGDTGPAGADGTNGTNGAPGIPFTHAPCAAKLTGPAQQENLLFCISGIEPDGSLVYKAAINAAASARIILGTPIAHTPSVDWSDRSIVYVEFTSEFHAEYHSPENIVRIYNASNQRVF